MKKAGKGSSHDVWYGGREGKGTGAQALMKNEELNAGAGKKHRISCLCGARRQARMTTDKAPKGANLELGMFRFEGWRVERVTLGKPGNPGIDSRKARQERKEGKKQEIGKIATNGTKTQNS